MRNLPSQSMIYNTPTSTSLSVGRDIKKVNMRFHDPNHTKNPTIQAAKMRNLPNEPLAVKV
jgi:hypothetical protein